MGRPAVSPAIARATRPCRPRSPRFRLASKEGRTILRRRVSVNRESPLHLWRERRMGSRRALDLTAIALLGGLLFLPNLGAYALWDIDEAHNAECAREMQEADTWIVPSFNF